MCQTVAHTLSWIFKMDCVCHSALSFHAQKLFFVHVVQINFYELPWFKTCAGWVRNIASPVDFRM